MVMTYATQKNNMNEPIEKDAMGKLKAPARAQKNPPNVNARTGAMNVKRINCGYAMLNPSNKTNNISGIIEILFYDISC